MISSIPQRNGIYENKLQIITVLPQHSQNKKEFQLDVFLTGAVRLQVTNQ
jgi:hypothetical protein